jgi:hypothetical protein
LVNKAKNADMAALHETGFDALFKAMGGLIARQAGLDGHSFSQTKTQGKSYGS